MVMILSAGLFAILGGVIALCVLRMPPEEDRSGRRFAFAVIGFCCVLLLYTAYTIDPSNIREAETRATYKAEAAYEVGYQDGWEDAAEEYLDRALHCAERYLDTDELFDFELAIQ